MLLNGRNSGNLFGLWTTDGTAGHTLELTDIAGAATTGDGLDPADMTVLGDIVLFNGTNSSGQVGLWETRRDRPAARMN